LARKEKEGQGLHRFVVNKDRCNGFASTAIDEDANNYDVTLLGVYDLVISEKICFRERKNPINYMKIPVITYQNSYFLLKLLYLFAI
jgi:hypothetical protein